MKNLILFDCYQTLIYKKNRELIIQKFLEKDLHIQVPLKHITYALNIMYHRYKLNQPRFQTPKSREKFYTSYNKELLRIIGLDISSSLAASLHKRLRHSPYACYSDTISTLQYYKYKKKYPLGIIANWTKGLKVILTKLKLGTYFDFIYSSHTMHIQKPSPMIFRKVLKNIMKKYDTIYYIGDDYELDVIPARQAGLTPILIDRDNVYPHQVDCLKTKNLYSIREIIK